MTWTNTKPWCAMQKYRPNSLKERRYPCFRLCESESRPFRCRTRDHTPREGATRRCVARVYHELLCLYPRNRMCHKVVGAPYKAIFLSSLFSLNTQIIFQFKYSSRRLSMSEGIVIVYKHFVYKYVKDELESGKSSDAGRGRKERKSTTEINRNM